MTVSSFLGLALERPSVAVYRSGGLPAAGSPVPVMRVAAVGGGDAADGVAGRVLADLLAQAHLMAPGALAGVLAERARPLGVRGVRIYLADLQQRYLHLLPGDAADSPAALSIDSTLAGRAFRNR